MSSPHETDPRYLAVWGELIRMQEKLCERLEKLRNLNGWKPGEVYQVLQDEGWDSLADYWYEWWLEGIESEDEAWE